MFDPADLAVAHRFAIALLIGALVGTERELRKTADQGFTFGGLRTFILVAQAGAVSAWLSLQLGQHWLFVATVVAVSAIVLTSYVLESRVKPDAAGLTTELAAISVCLLGGAVIYGHAATAVALAIVTAAVLAYKQPLHRLVGKIGSDDLYAGLRLLIATFIVLPLLPDRPVDPWQALNPYKLWLLVTLISGLSMAGYVAVRWLGSARGAAVTGLTGGLVSSTAVTLSFARQSRVEAGARAGDALATGVLLAWLVMFARVLVAVAVVHAPLLPALFFPYAVMAAVTAGFAAVCALRGRGDRGVPPATAVPLKNPFSLWEASKFGLLFAVVLLVVKLTEVYFQGGGIYLVAGLAGLTDVDAITLSMAEYARQGGSHEVAVGSIVVATLTNTLVKGGLIVALGSAAMRGRVLAATGGILAAGLAALLVA